MGGLRPAAARGLMSMRANPGYGASIGRIKCACAAGVERAHARVAMTQIVSVTGRLGFEESDGK